MMNFAAKTEIKKHSPLPEKMKGVIPDLRVLELMPRNIVENLRAYPFEKKGDEIKVAAVNPGLPALQRYAAEKFGKNVAWFTADESDIAYIVKNYKRNFGAEITELVDTRKQGGESNVAIVDCIIEYALAKRASDIHIEPTRGETLVRFRVDGILQNVANMPREVHPAVVARLKLLANLKIDEYRHPQDGRVEFDNLPGISLRISTVPTIYGEKIALRMLDESQKDFSVSLLGFSPEHEDILMKNIEKPFGMIVTSGPTGSGKTTTLYGILSLLKKDRVNISTLEDPVEYALAGINQIQINPRINFTFASGLRALLRQDPDVIMVGEMRDSETAVMAANAALTGHLVLTTIHTNDSPSVFTRLMEMKVEDFTVGSVVNLIIAQRLVRQVCPSCSKENKLDEALIKKIKERKDVVGALKEIGKDVNDLSKMKFYHGVGCEECLATGYRGRIGMFELLELHKEIYNLILSHASSERIKAEAMKEGFKDMMNDGMKKVFAGKTTFEEVLRATRSV